MEYKLVPVEPTDDQIDAAHSDLDAWRRIHGQYLLSDAEAFALYNSMLAAAPSPAWEAFTLYNSTLAAAPLPAWIETAERLPTREDADEIGNLYVADAHDVYQIAYYNVRPEECTHWMPKPRVQPPEPPEGLACPRCGERFDSVAGMYPDSCRDKQCPYGGGGEHE